MRKHSQRSVFLKLFYILMAAAISLSVVVVVGWHVGHKPPVDARRFVDDNIELYLSALADEILAAPAEALRAVHKRTGFDVKTEGALELSTSETLSIPSAERKGPSRRSMGNVVPGWSKDRGFLAIEKQTARGPVRFYFFGPRGAPRGFPFDVSTENLVGIISAVILIMAVAFLLIRRVLSPISDLVVAVNQVGKGNLSFNLKESGNDELSALAASFNHMTKQLKEMMTAKERLLADVSHELRSPVTRAKLALEFVKDETVRESIGEDINEMEHMIHGLLESARLQSGAAALRLEGVDVPSIVRDEASKLGAAGESITIRFEGSGEIRADKDQIRVLLKNLLENAVKYSPRSGSIQVLASIAENQIVLLVRDQGPGIPSTDLQRVFEPFYRVDDSRTRETGGYGLGLSLCHRIVSAHQGAISISCPKEGGTVVEVRLPVSGPKLT